LTGCVYSLLPLQSRRQSELNVARTSKEAYFIFPVLDRLYANYDKGLVRNKVDSVNFNKRALTQKFVLTLLLWSAGFAACADFDHSQWDKLLQANVVVIDDGHASQVNYDAMLRERTTLKLYLDSIAVVSRDSFESWPYPAQLAFLINAYNAWTVELILTEYPAIDSIRQIGFFFNSAWRRKLVSLFGGQVSLDELEHGMIRGWGRYQEPRIHFAVNCAAIGCPGLRAEAYLANKLEEQLDDSTRMFLADRSRNYLSGKRLTVSRVFDWYEEDFKLGWGGIDSVSEFLSGYGSELGLNPQQIEKLQDNELRIRFQRYDWGLNRTP